MLNDDAACSGTAKSLKMSWTGLILRAWRRERLDEFVQVRLATARQDLFPNRVPEPQNVGEAFTGRANCSADLDPDWDATGGH
jgi:hypothetical protein